MINKHSSRNRKEILKLIVYNPLINHQFCESTKEVINILHKISLSINSFISFFFFLPKIESWTIWGNNWFDQFSCVGRQLYKTQKCISFVISQLPVELVNASIEPATVVRLWARTADSGAKSSRHGSVDELHEGCVQK